MRTSVVVGDLRHELGLCEARSLLTAAHVGLLACSIDVDLFIKSDACSETDWTYINGTLSSSVNEVLLVEGVTYYILIDDENTAPSEGTVMITCPVPVADQTDDPCDSVVELQCGIAANFELPAGSGAWNPPDGTWGTPGNEVVYSYTPTASEAYTTTVTNNNYCKFVLPPPPLHQHNA